jgi:hypothetical protein
MYAYVAELSAHAITHRVRRRTDALFPLCDERRFAVERARVLGCASGRRVIRIYATLPVHGIVDLAHVEIGEPRLLNERRKN